MNATPRVSVVLPVYNGSMFLREAIDSILNQTMQDLELVIVDDGSTDSSREIIASVTDPRVVTILRDRNYGLADTLNLGVDTASASLIARQDQDDLSFPQRLARQVDFLASHPQVGLLGTWAEIRSIDNHGTWRPTGAHRHPDRDVVLRWRLLWNNPFVHSSVMFDRQIFQDAGRYGTDPRASFPEDYDLWSRMAPHTCLANLPEALVSYRQSPSGMSRTRSEDIKAGILRIGGARTAAITGRASDDPVILGALSSLNGFREPQGSVGDAAARIRVMATAARRIAELTGETIGLEAPYAYARIAFRTLHPGVA